MTAWKIYWTILFIAAAYAKISLHSISTTEFLLILLAGFIIGGIDEICKILKTIAPQAGPTEAELAFAELQANKACRDKIEFTATMTSAFLTHRIDAFPEVFKWLYDPLYDYCVKHKISIPPGRDYICAQCYAEQMNQYDQGVRRAKIKVS